MHTFDVSDAFHAISLILLIVLTIEYTIVFPGLLKLVISTELGTGPTESEFKGLLSYRVVTSCVWLVSIYCVKFNFLSSYKSLFGVSQHFLRVWWAITVFTILSLWVCLGLVFAECGGRIQDSLNPCEYL